MKKTLKIMIVAILLMVIATTVNAYTNDELIAYLTSSKTVAGETVTLTSDEKGAIRSYLEENPLSDEDAAKVKAQAEEVIAIMDAAGTTDITELSDADKSKITSLVNSAADIAGVVVNVDAGKKTVSVETKAGKTLFAEDYTTRKTITYTGANYAMYIVPVVAIIAVAMVVVIKRSK